jgi:hypothetical protein
MQDKAEDKAKFMRESLQLQRLERMVDVVYAIITIPFAFVGPILWEISWLSASIRKYSNVRNSINSI